MSWTVRVLSENIDKHFDSHNHVGHYVIPVVMQGTGTAHRNIGGGYFCQQILSHKEIQKQYRNDSVPKKPKTKR